MQRACARVRMALFSQGHASDSVVRQRPPLSRPRACPVPLLCMGMRTDKPAVVIRPRFGHALPTRQNILVVEVVGPAPVRIPSSHGVMRLLRVHIACPCRQNICRHFLNKGLWSIATFLNKHALTGSSNVNCKHLPISLVRGFSVFEDTRTGS